MRKYPSPDGVKAHGRGSCYSGSMAASTACLPPHMFLVASESNAELIVANNFSVAMSESLLTGLRRCLGFVHAAFIVVVAINRDPVD